MTNVNFSALKKILIAGVLSLSFTCGYHSANAEEYNFVSLQYPPIAFAEPEGGAPKGMAVELVTEAFKRMGHKINIKVQSWARSLDDVKKGKADAIFTAFKNPEREKFLDYSNEVVVPQQVSVFVSTASKLDASKMGYSGDPSVFSKYQIGVRRKVSYGTVIDSMIKNNKFKNVQTTNRPESNLRKLVKGRFDIMPMNRYVAWYLAKSIGEKDNLKEILPPVQDIPSYIAFSKKRKLTSLRDEFDKEFAKMRTDGTYEKIIAKYTK